MSDRSSISKSSTYIWRPSTKRTKKAITKHSTRWPTMRSKRYPECPSRISGCLSSVWRSTFLLISSRIWIRRNWICLRLWSIGRRREGFSLWGIPIRASMGGVTPIIRMLRFLKKISKLDLSTKSRRRVSRLATASTTRWQNWPTPSSHPMIRELITERRDKILSEGLPTMGS